MDLTAEIRSIVRDYLQNETLADVVFATYLGGTIKIDGKPTEIDSDFVVMPYGMTLVSGDRISVIRQHGGQKYVVLGKIS